MTKFADSRFLDWVYPMIDHSKSLDSNGQTQIARITPSQFRLLFLIHKVSGEDGWTEQISFRELANKAGLSSIGTIKTDLEHLSKIGLLLKRYGQSGVPYSYKLTFHLQHEKISAPIGKRRLKIRHK